MPVPSPESQLDGGRPSAANDSRTDGHSSVSHSDRISQLMGQNLLRGFALLDQYCDHCSTPLMRDPHRKLICISCSLTPPNKSPDRQSDHCSKPAEQRKPAAVEQVRGFDCDAVLPVLQSKLEWAVRKLQATTDVSECIELNAFIRGVVENMKLLSEINSQRM